MAAYSKFLSLPLEIRHQIYFYVLPGPISINIVRDDMDGPLKNSLFHVCLDIYHEAFQYYYSVNTFVLDLSDPAYAPNRFVNGTKGLLRYFRRVQTLRLIIGDSASASHDSCALSEYAREQLDWFLRSLGQANGDREGFWLRNLVVMDYCETSIPEEVTKGLLERGEKRRDVLVSLLQPLRNKIGSNLSVESRALSRVRRYDHMRDTLIGIIAADIYTLMNFADSATAPDWDIVVGVSQMNPSTSLSYGGSIQSVPN